MTVSHLPWQLISQELSETLSKIDANSFDQLVQIFSDTDRRWFFSGQGRSGLSAQMAAMRFMHIGRIVHFVGEVSAPSIRQNDGLVIISGSGQTPVSLNFAQIAKSEGATVVAVTRDAQSPLAQMSDMTMLVPTIASVQFGGSLFEQCSLLVLDSVILQLTAGIPDVHEAMQHRHTNLQ
ncbi:SIS domain-containing protein [Phyllobacterium sp. YR531]|uniref:SIS domain-containing protein n=1 Tax=Phyllobacterium sp. YR531 TaxID=1144343 RepID=UPI00026F878F|nr:SIS domain-containing protein [Phyllobacterium sp. YR531]EJM99617.1 putative sugar phosphate isomerase involved in capsule formation [Phyllobacterium sp. YR531]